VVKRYHFTLALAVYMVILFVALREAPW